MLSHLANAHLGLRNAASCRSHVIPWLSAKSLFRFQLYFPRFDIASSLHTMLDSIDYLLLLAKNISAKARLHLHC
jgi:hypothetical protein